MFVALAMSRGKHNVTVWHLSVCMSVPSFYNYDRVCCAFFLTIIEPSAHTQHDSPASSTWRGQCTFLSEYYEDGYLLMVIHCAYLLSSLDDMQYWFCRLGVSVLLICILRLSCWICKQF